MPLHINEDHVISPITFDGDKLEFDGPKFAGRYLSAAADSDGAASFIDADTNVGGTFAFSLRDTDHATNMHYWIRVDVGTNSLTVQRESGSTKTINGSFVGQTFSDATSLSLLRDDGILRIKPSGDNWAIY